MDAKQQSYPRVHGRQTNAMMTLEHAQMELQKATATNPLGRDGCMPTADSRASCARDHRPAERVQVAALPHQQRCHQGLMTLFRQLQCHQPLSALVEPVSTKEIIATIGPMLKDTVLMKNGVHG